MSNSKPDQQNWQGLVAEFQHTSDRAVVILGSTYLENHLGHLLRCFFVDHPQNSSMLLEAEKPLGCLGPLICTAFALGLISQNEFHDLSLTPLKKRSDKNYPNSPSSKGRKFNIIGQLD